MRKDNAHKNLQESCFLPDFCNVYTVFLVIIVTELLAFVVVLVPLGHQEYPWDYVKNSFLADLAMVSWFIQWVSIVSQGLLCWARRALVQLKSDVLVGLLSYFLILAVTTLISELAWLFNQYSFVRELTFSLDHLKFLLISLSLSALVGLVVLGVTKKKSWGILIYVIFLVTVGVACELTAMATPSEEALAHGLFVLRNLGISAIITAIALRYFYVQYQWKRETEMAISAQLQALQARIHPHFLFNSMNTIASLIRFAPHQAEQAVEDFADLFRSALSNPQNLVSWPEELMLCEQYLRLEKLRLGERLQIVWKIGEIPEDVWLPPLCLQPLLENAIYHGIQSLPQGGSLELTASFDGKYLQIEIYNPKGGHSSHQGHQMAQANIQQRLQAHYGRQAYFKRQDAVDHYQVILRFPCPSQLSHDRR